MKNNRKALIELLTSCLFSFKYDDRPSCDDLILQLNNVKLNKHQVNNKELNYFKNNCDNEFLTNFLQVKLAK